jgi:hypothetical protein
MSPLGQTETSAHRNVGSTPGSRHLSSPSAPRLAVSMVGAGGAAGNTSIGRRRSEQVQWRGAGNHHHLTNLGDANLSPCAEDGGFEFL